MNILDTAKNYGKKSFSTNNQKNFRIRQDQR
jgi:hypothetical protein